MLLGVGLYSANPFRMMNGLASRAISELKLTTDASFLLRVSVSDRGVNLLPLRVTYPHVHMYIIVYRTLQAVGTPPVTSVCEVGSW